MALKFGTGAFRYVSGTLISLGQTRFKSD